MVMRVPFFIVLIITTLTAALTIGCETGIRGRPFLEDVGIPSSPEGSDDGGIEPEATGDPSDPSEGETVTVTSEPTTKVTIQGRVVLP